MSKKGEPGNSDQSEVSFRQLEDFRLWAERYQQMSKAPSFLNFALTELRRSTRQHSDQLAFKRRLLENSLALVDSSTKHILNDEGKLKFTQENRKKLVEGMEKLMNDTVKIDPIWCTELPDDLPPLFLEYFIGFCVKPFATQAEYETFFKLTKKTPVDGVGTSA